MSARVRYICLLPALFSIGVAACGTPTTPTPGVGFPALTCPVSIKVPAAGLVTHVSYSGPFASGGTPPDTVSCSVASNSVFPVGVTAVTCSVTDATGRLAACTFNVTVLPPPLLVGTTFLAFGDSLAAGENGVNDGHPILCGASPARVGVAFIDCPNSYHMLLQSLLAARYVVQTPVVCCNTNGGPFSDGGVDGELALGENLGGAVPGGTDRIGSALDHTHPDALLLLEGINDLVGETESFQDVISALGYDIDQARLRSLKKVFISTLTPVRLGSRISASFLALNSVQQLNDLIRALAAQKGAVLVDSYAALAGNTGAYISDDGLHPTPLGNQQIAQAFFAAIEATFELPPTPGAVQHRR
jgi:lysophospholipase L1-like esterase